MKYRGYTIKYECGYYWTNGVPFDSMQKAKDEIDYWLDELVDL